MTAVESVAVASPVIALLALAWSIHRGRQELSETKLALQRNEEELRLSRLQMKDDHDYRRRHATVMITQMFNSALTKDMGVARRLACTLSREAQQNLKRSYPVICDNRDSGPLLVALFGTGEMLASLQYRPDEKSEWEIIASKEIYDKLVQGAQGQVRLDVPHVAVLRSHVITYYNLLESVFLAARMEVAERKMILTEFRPLAEGIPSQQINGVWDLDIPESNIGWALAEYRSQKNTPVFRPTGDQADEAAGR